MARKYKPATFQPTIRPDWGGVLSYIPDDEKINILEALLKYPSVDCNSKLWLETIKPDLDLQYEEFVKQCEAKSRGVRNRWGKTSITPLIDENDICNRYVIVSEGEGEGDGAGDGEGEGEGEGIGIAEREDKKESIVKLNYETLFFDFWQNYIPVKCDGRFVDKGSKKLSFEKFVRILKSGVKYEDIIAGLHAYLNHCRENKQLTCTVPVFLNQQRWTDDYNTATVIAEDTARKRQEPKSIVETYAEIAAKYAAEDNLY